ncbi:MAG TPA: EamA family transporter [Thermoplasmata archaeon]|nr:EamA family transporter [Thermoplasmata archaeon]
MSKVGAPVNSNRRKEDDPGSSVEAGGRAVVESVATRRTLGLLLLVGAVWGATFPVVRYGVNLGAAPFPLIAVDFLVAAGGMAVVASVRTPGLPTLRSFAGSMGLGLVLVGGINLVLFWAVQFTTGGIAAIVFATAPLLSILTSRVLGVGASPSRTGLVGLAGGLAGVAVIGLSSAGTAALTNPWAIVALVGGATAQAVGAALVARYRPSGETLWGQAGQFSSAGLAALLVAGATGSSFSVPATLPVALTVAYVAMLTGVVGYAAYFALIREAGAVRANLVTYLNPLVALAVGFVVFAEAVSLAELLGLAIVLGSLYLLHRPSGQAASTRAIST